MGVFMSQDPPPITWMILRQSELTQVTQPIVHSCCCITLCTKPTHSNHKSICLIMRAVRGEKKEVTISRLWNSGSCSHEQHLFELGWLPQWQELLSFVKTGNSRYCLHHSLNFVFQRDSLVQKKFSTRSEQSWPILTSSHLPTLPQSLPHLPTSKHFQYPSPPKWRPVLNFLKI